MNKRAQLALLLSGCIVLMGCAATRTATREAPQDHLRYRIIAYARPSSSMALSEIDASRLTHINYAFADVQNNRIILRRDDDARHLADLVALRNDHPHLKILVSVGGWSWSDNFSDAALTDSSRKSFAQSGVALIREHQLDGIDLDWEYPGLPGEDNIYRAEDKQNFTLMLRELREQLDALAREEGRSEVYLLTIAAGAGPSYLANTEMNLVHQYLDHINLMTYDFRGAWTEETGHHTNLFGSGCNEISSDEAVRAFLDAGVPPEKIVLGAAFYGRSWTGVSLKDSGFCQPYDSSGRSFSYAALEEGRLNRDGTLRIWDEEARAPYLLTPETGEFITYEDASSLQHKALYVREQGLGGVMFWSYDHDPSGKLLRVLHSYLAVR